MSRPVDRPVSPAAMDDAWATFRQWLAAAHPQGGQVADLARAKGCDLSDCLGVTMDGPANTMGGFPIVYFGEWDADYLAVQPGGAVRYRREPRGQGPAIDLPIKAKVHPDATLFALAEERAELSRRIDATWDGVKSLPDYEQADAEALADTLTAEHYAVERRLFAERATTPEGLRAKARILAETLGDEPDGTYEDFLTRNLLADILAGA